MKLSWSNHSLVLLLTSFSLAQGLSSAVATKAKVSAGGTGVHVPVGKDGDGFYSASTKGCFDVIDAATPLVLEEIQKQQGASSASTSSSAYHIADYGTADGGTSLGLLTKMVQALRNDNNSNNREVVLHYEDQVTNEWQSVFKHVLGMKSVVDAYGNTIPTPFALGNVYTEATGIGFHNQCYPSGSIDFGVSFTAMHWLSSVPGSLRGNDRMHAARCSTPTVAEKEIAANDWKSILRARANELKEGGRFVCVNFCITKEGYFLGQTDVGTSMWDSFQSSWDQLKEQGLIDEEERLGVSFPNYYRTTEEFLQGVKEIPELELISIDEKITPCPYREQYNSGGKDTMTPRQYAESFVPTTKTWSDSTFRSALHSDRSDKDKVMEQFWENYMKLVEQNPSVHGMDYAHAFIVLEKKGMKTNTGNEEL